MPVNTCTSGTCQVAPTEAAIIRHFGPSPRRRSSERCHVDRAVTSKRLLLGSFQRPSFGSRQLRELSRLPSDGKATDLSGSDGRRSQAGRNGGSWWLGRKRPSPFSNSGPAPLRKDGREVYGGDDMASPGHQLMMVQVPAGMSGGQTLQVQTPAGQVQQLLFLDHQIVKQLLGWFL